jgi:hypothetical protein
MGRRDKSLHPLLVLLVVLALPQPALADKTIVVGNRTAASCTEAAMKNALLVAEASGGGTISFKCGPQPVTIALSGVTEIEGMLVLLILPNNTTVDGGGLITLDGTNTATVVFVDRGTSASLKRLTITNGNGPSRFDQFSPGGIANFGTLAITSSAVLGNLSCCFFDRTVGGIWNTGTLQIDNSRISDNFGTANGGIANEGTLRIHNTIIADNVSTDFGGGILNLATIEITNSSFLRNSVGDGFGGAILNSGTLTVKRSLFAENEAAHSGGGIANFGTLDVRHSRFAQNIGGFGSGGGIYSGGGSGGGALAVNESTFSGNRSGTGGGGMFVQSDSGASVRKSTFSNNAAMFGGGIFNAAALTVKDSTIAENAGFIAGGGIYNCVEGDPVFVPGLVFPCDGTLTLKHTTVTENTPDGIFP